MSDDDGGMVIQNKNVNQSGTRNVAQVGNGKQSISESHVAPPIGSRAKRFGVGVCLLGFAMALAAWGFSLGTLTPDQRNILLWALPLASGFACTAFAGGISAKAQGFWPGVAVTATGGFAVWFLTAFLLFPKAAVPATSGSSPPPTPATNQMSAPGTTPTTASPAGAGTGK